MATLLGLHGSSFAMSPNARETSCGSKRTVDGNNSIWNFSTRQLLFLTDQACQAHTNNSFFWCIEMRLNETAAMISS
jgi:hypothetical protein